MMEGDTTGSGRLSSVAAALRLLKTFSADDPELGITELARRLGVAKSTAHRLAATLLAEGFLEQNPSDGRYRLGLALFGLGTLVRRRMTVSSEALPFLHALRDRSDETVHLAVLDGADIVYLFNLESHQAIRMRSYLGVRKPAVSTSEGRALLAFSPAAQLARVLQPPAATAPVAAGTQARETLAGVLEAVRRSGYAEDDEESEHGMRGVAAPVFDAGGAAVASVGLAGPVQRLTRKRLREVVPMVLEAARGISQRLGHAGA